MKQSLHHHYTIGIDARMLGPEQTGIGKYIARLLEFVPPCMPRVRFVVFLKESAFHNFTSPHANIETRKVSAHWYGWREQLVLPFKFLRAHMDLMHFPHFNVPLAYRKPFVVTIHDTTPHTFPGHRMGSWVRRAGFWLTFRSAVERAREVIAVSAYTKNDIQTLFGTPAERIGVIYEGIDQIFNTVGAPAISMNVLHAYGIRNPYLLYVGVWREHKNIVGLLKAYALLRNQYGISHVLVLTGKEHAAYPAVRHTIQKLHLEQSVHIPGFVQEKDLVHFYRAASLTVVPSFSEGFGFTGLESLACGTPVVASRATSLPEVLGDGTAYFNPHDPANMARIMYDVLTEEALRRHMLENAKKILPRYRWEKMAEETAACYLRVLTKVVRWQPAHQILHS